MLNRRSFIACAVSTSLAAPLHAKTSDLTIALCGQSLLEFDLNPIRWDGRDALRRALRASDVAFTDFEGTVRGSRGGHPTRVLETVHAPSAAALTFLKELGLNLFATSNNHAFDLGTGGVLDTIEAMQERALAFAGTGRDLAEASAPAAVCTRHGRVSLVAAATGAVRAGGAAAEGRPGVNELRLDERRQLVGEDEARYLHAIRSAAHRGGPVIAYLHNHDWEANNADTPEWQRALARATVDAGASAFVSHGPPLLHGIELYAGVPLFHGLGSLFFQTRKAEGAYGPLNWQAVIAACRFRGSQFVAATIHPWQLASTGLTGPNQSITRGLPRRANRGESEAILRRLSERSARLGYRLDHDGLVARIKV